MSKVEINVDTHLFWLSLQWKIKSDISMNQCSYSNIFRHLPIIFMIYHQMKIDFVKRILVLSI